MRLGMSRRTTLLVLAGIFLAGNLGFFLWYRSTAQERKAGMEARRDALARDVEAKEKEAAVLSGQRDRLSRVSEAIDEFYGRRVGTPRDTLAPIVVELHSLLTKANVAPLQIGYATRPVPTLPLSEMTIAFGFRNDYNQLRQLLALIESDRKWIVVRDIGVNRDKEFPGQVQVRMTLATYFSRREGDELPKTTGLLSELPVRPPVADAAAPKPGSPPSSARKGGSR
jgi:Tfp pilus assembly protein PilO